MHNTNSIGKNILIKVGISLITKFRWGQNNVFRAIQIADVSRILKVSKDIDIIILENIDYSEVSELEDILDEYSNIDVIVHSKDEEANEIANKLGLRAYGNSVECMSYIENTLGINLKRNIEYKHLKRDKEDGGYDVTLECVEKDKEKDIYISEEKLREKESLIASLEKERDTLLGSIELDRELSSIKEKGIAGLESIIEELERNNYAKEVEIRTLEADKYELRNKLEDYRNTIDEKVSLLEKLQNELKDCESEKNVIMTELDTFRRAGNEDLEKIKIEKIELMTEVEKLNSSSVYMDKEIQQLGDKCSSLNEEMSKKEIDYNIRINELLSDRLSIDDVRREYDDIVKSLRGSNNELRKINEQLMCEAQSHKDSLMEEYHGKARVIPVMGSGSYGVTIVAVSMAKKLSDYKVLLIDADMISPKIDRWIGVSPILKDIDDVEVSMRTGLGVIAVKGSDYINNNTITKRWIQTRDGCVDYLSGMYKVFDTDKLTLEISKVLNIFGDYYDYIIIDCGKLGLSEAGDKINVYADSIAYKTVVVVIKDNADIRNMAMRINHYGLNIKNHVWVLNFADDTIVDKSIQETIKGAKITILPKDMSIYGSVITLDKVNIIRDRLSILVDLIAGG